jgi:DNA-binding MarR family transcriptional regulator
VPRIVDKLVEKKLVKRSSSKEDKRETIIALSENGLRQLNNASLILDETTSTILGLDEAEAAQLNALLEKMRKTI